MRGQKVVHEVLVRRRLAQQARQLLELLNAQQRAQQAPRVGVHVQVAVDERDGRVEGQRAVPAQRAHFRRELARGGAARGVEVEAAVDEHGHAVAPHGGRRRERLVQVGQARAQQVELLARRVGKGADAHVREHREGFRQAAPAALGRVHRAEQAPARVVQLARLGVFRFARDGRVDLAQQRERRGGRHAPQLLRDAVLRGVAARGQNAPIPRRERVAKGLRELLARDERAHVGVVQLPRLGGAVQLRLQALFRRAKHLAKQQPVLHARAVDALGRKVVAVVALQLADVDAHELANHEAQVQRLGA